ncbi:O-antigen ligase family protein [Parvicella tangerina]|uniref:O-antigen ligase-related domain-containing protein n=1 Tax=Parvicella tangerina TaxID=2829795 RepID=A0A916JK76_9FLAO|nr:O-antigen ligase family protein [Parvicella tangerina]CAG5076359.1 hypothetical protein CRYO30217_00083 [Parvicella tangerina]
MLFQANKKIDWVYLLVIGALGFLLTYFQYHGKLHQLFYGVFFLLAVAFTSFQLKKLDRFYLLIAFLSPVSFSIDIIGGFSLKSPLEPLLMLSLFVFIVKASMNYRTSKFSWKHPLVLLLILDLMWTFISTVNSELTAISLKRFAMNNLYFIGFFFLFQQTVKSDQKRLFHYFGLGMIIPILFTSLQHGVHGFAQNYSFNVSQPFFDDHTQYGAIAAFVIPYFALNLKKNGKTVYLNSFVLAALIVAVLTSYSRGAWISLIAAFALYVSLKLHFKVKHILVILVGLSVFISVNFSNYYDGLKHNEVKYDDNISNHLSSVTNLQNDASNLERINRWVCAYRMYEERPIFGFGPGTYQFLYDNFQTPEYMTRISTHKGDKGNAHSEILNRLAEQGIVSSLLFLAISFLALSSGIRRYHASSKPETKKLILASLLGLTTFYIHGLFNTFSDIAEMAILVYGSMAILLTVDINEAQREA